jgi:AraC-like DNA-binding protein
MTNKAPTTTLHIRNMVCDRCIRVVREELEALHIDIRRITLGEAMVAGKLSPERLREIREALERNGFELIEDRRVRTVERIKLAALKLARNDDPERKRTASAFIAAELGQDYHSLSTLFTSMESITIEQFIILQKIERVKELLKYGELTLSEIAYRLGYSSVAHLSNQFKKVTGMTPSQFKKMITSTRTPLDRVSQ